MRLAIFDFDGTIFKGETLLFIVKQYAKMGYSKVRLVEFYIKIIALTVLYKLKIYPDLDKEQYRGKVAVIFMVLYKKMKKDAIEKFFHECSIEMRQYFNENVVKAIKEKKEAGYHTVICSGANTMLLKTVGEYLGVHDVIGTELSFLPDGSYDFEAPLHIISGKNKPKAVLDRYKHLDVTWDESYAYGDSYYDQDILMLTGNPIAVNPDEQLLAIATEKGWEIL